MGISSLPAHRLVFGVFLWLVLDATVSCNRRQDAIEKAPLVELERQIGYRPGAWWRDADSLNTLLLAGSQIVITHAAATGAEQGKDFVRPRPERSREQALRLALKLKVELHAYSGTT